MHFKPGKGPSRGTGDGPKGAGRASALPRKNNSACRNENRAIVGTGMKILFGQKLEVCLNQQKFINCETSLELDISKCRYLNVQFSSSIQDTATPPTASPPGSAPLPLSATVHSIEYSRCKVLRYDSCDDLVGRKIL